MRIPFYLLGVLTGVCFAAAHPRGHRPPSGECKRIQHAFPPATNKGNPNAHRAEAVKQAYLNEWNVYMKYAFPNDDLKPLSHSYVNDFFGWGTTVVDGIDTAIIMGLTEVVESQLAHIASIDFTYV